MMDIRLVADLLARELAASLPTEDYGRIREWCDWWRGYSPPFHRFRESDGAGGVRERRLFTMKMAKKICEDWAGILLGEPPRLVVADRRSDVFLQGESGQGGALAECRFWSRAGALVEQAFYSGTGAFVLRVHNLRTDASGVPEPSPDARLEMQYLPALCILPITVRCGEIVEAAFCSEVLEGGRACVYVETHLLRGGGYLVENRFFEEKHGALLPIPLPPGVAPLLRTGCETPLFAAVRPNNVGAYPHSGLGEAVFANAIDNLKGVDLAFNNFCRDFQLGGKKVFYHRSLLVGDSASGLLAPDDICQQLFVSVGERMPDDSPLIVEHNPALRVADNIAGIQAQLDYLSLLCGLGAKFYRFDNGAIVTATQYAGDRQELVRGAAKHSVPLGRALRGVMRMLLWAGRAVKGAAVDPDTDIGVHFDDSVIIDKETERQRDRADVAAGLMRKFEYRMKWFGESEEAARAATRDGLPA